MTQALLQMMAAGSPVVPIYVDDVFSTVTRSGTGASATITNNIDLSAKGGLVITKARSAATGWRFTDTARGVQTSLDSSSAAANATESTGLTAFTTTGYTVGADSDYNNSTGPVTYADYTFRKALKFFDMVTGTTNGSGNIALSHSLGVTPGMVILKSTAASGSWIVYHTSLGTDPYLVINESGAAANAGLFSGVTTTSFSATNPFGLQDSTYVAYLFAHDTGADGLIQCGSLTTDGSGGATVNHGWSAGVQFALVKCSSTTGDWEMYDTARTSGWSGSDARLRANLSNAEDSVTRLSASGTSVTFAGLSNSATYIYMFIKAP